MTRRYADRNIPPPMKGFLGLISDTHGLLRPEAIAALDGAQRIFHAGDIGNPGILDELRRIAPVDAVRGNNDRDEWAEVVPPVLVASVGGLSIGMLHDLKEATRYQELAGCEVIISGHSHKPGIHNDAGVLHVNPGSAGRRRFKLPVTVGRLRIVAGKPVAEIVRIVET